MLTLNLKKEWFDKIKSGQKTHEYRVMSDYWIKRIDPLGRKPEIVTRLVGDISKNRPSTKFIYDDFSFKNSDGIIFCCGYPKKDDKEKRLYARIKAISTNVNGLYTDLKIDKPVYDIEFELQKA